EIGIRLGDIAGRLDTIALASLGRGDSPHGAAIASAWRGWPVELLAHLYRVDELHDRERGAELRARWSATFPLHSIEISGGTLLADRSRRPAFIEAESGLRQVRGTTRMREDIAISGEAGSDRRHARVRAAASIDFGRIGFAAELQRDRARDGSTIEVGGLVSSITPRSARATRVVDPALPFRAITGDHYRGARVEARLGSLTFFHQEHRTTDHLRLTGVEFAASTPPFALVRLPALAITAGCAHGYDAPVRGENKFWIGIRWEP
ncbi:MAG: hypothetical protein ACXV7D_05295, partial [Thermoanaerobaculia bacterium]